MLWISRYDATIEAYTPNGYYVSYDNWGNKEEVRLVKTTWCTPDDPIASHEVSFVVMHKFPSKFFIAICFTFYGYFPAPRKIVVGVIELYRCDRTLEFTLTREAFIKSFKLITSLGIQITIKWKKNATKLKFKTLNTDKQKYWVENKDKQKKGKLNMKIEKGRKKRTDLLQSERKQKKDGRKEKIGWNMSQAATE